MLELKNVSKFYYNKGVVASGFSKINLNLNMGEFVVITGESGSGKSTLLNVISGLDSYEEGEMYINGEETSYYSDNDFEEYRKKYVSNIFQNFNLVNSYTVYQNIELVMLLNGYKRKEVKKKKKNQNVTEPGLDYYRFDSKWYTEICNDESFKVSGHFRLQPYGDGTRRLIWINEFTKNGYHRKATIDKVKDGEVSLT